MLLLVLGETSVPRSSFSRYLKILKFLQHRLVAMGTRPGCSGFEPQPKHIFFAGVCVGRGKELREGNHISISEFRLMIVSGEGSSEYRLVASYLYTSK